MSKRGLGRGLSALIPGSNLEQGDKSGEIRLDEIVPNPYQPRRVFDQGKLDELAESVKKHGVLQPIVVRKAGEKYEIVVGERRFRAAQQAGLETIPAIVREYDDRDMMQIALVENLQREDLNPIEEAEGYRRLIDEFGLTQEELGAVLGKSRSAIANTLRLLKLDPFVQENVSRGTLSMGHARALLALESPADQVRACRKVVEEGLSVRQTEELVKRLLTPAQRVKHRKESVRDPNIVEIEDRLKRSLGTQVRIKPGQKRSVIEIEYYSQEDLERILERVLL